MNIQGGAISFEALFESGSIERGLKTTEQLVKNFTSLTAQSGANIDAEYQKISAAIQNGFNTIGNAINDNQTKVKQLTDEYARLGIEANKAGGSFSIKLGGSGMMTEAQAAISKQIASLKQAENGLQEQDRALVKLNSDIEAHKAKTDNASNSQMRFRTQLMNVKQKMMELEQAGKRNTTEYARLTEEAKRLANAMYAANQQVKVLTTTKGSALQGLVTGLSGVSGAFTAAQGAMGLFADKNEELQKIMLKVQSLMSITMGLQAVSATLHQTSAFSLMFLAKAQNAYTASMEISRRAAQMGVIANVGLAASFRAVGAAIKAIPVFGWIIAGISALVGVISIFSSKAREAKKASEEFNKAVSESASKPIATIKKLENEWNRLGDNLQAKEKFIKDNKKSFDELNLSVKGVADAENLLTNPAHVQNFINAQIAKAKANAMYAKSEKDIADLTEAELKLAEAKKTPKVTRYYSNGTFAGMGSYEIDNPEIAKWEKKQKELQSKIRKSYEAAADYEKEGAEELNKAGIEGAKDYEKGTIGYYEKIISEKRELQKNANKELYDSLQKEIDENQKKIDAITGGKKNKTSQSGESAAEKAKKQAQERADLLTKIADDEAKAD
ncbi:MAG: hypothetical protein FWF53_03010, partial [Candidatus Azobacteroides sp.]|nr:hypothetical protein [Candidatus Azobacteroides sp.]